MNDSRERPSPEEEARPTTRNGGGSRRDVILASFLEHQYEEITALAARSDVIEILRHAPLPPSRYIIRFHCRSLVKNGTGIEEVDRIDVGLRFADDYLRRADVAETVTLLWPPTIFHPNVRFPFICTGKLRPGTSARDLVYQLYEIFTYYRVVMREDDALNHEACAWARRNQARFPLEIRPLCRRELSLRVSQSPVDGPGSADGKIEAATGAAKEAGHATAE